LLVLILDIDLTACQITQSRAVSARRVPHRAPGVGFKVLRFRVWGLGFWFRPCSAPRERERERARARESESERERERESARARARASEMRV
jgi:hypothetical protein